MKMLSNVKMKLGLLLFSFQDREGIRGAVSEASSTLSKFHFLKHSPKFPEQER